jgi:uncharacterized protein (DUF1330 family)
MKPFLSALFILAAFSSPLNAQTPPMAGATQAQVPGYLIVVGKTTDRAKIGAYAAALPPIYASHNAYYAAIGGAGRGVTWLEGPWQDRSLIFARFPSRSEIDAFWWGEPYRAAIRKRDNAGVFSVLALSGDVPFEAEGAGKGYLIVMTATKDASEQQAQRSANAAAELIRTVTSSGGLILAAKDKTQFTALEGDTLFDRVVIAAWPSLAARDTYLASGDWRRTNARRGQLGLSVVISANGVPRNQAPPAAMPNAK